MADPIGFMPDSYGINLRNEPRRGPNSADSPITTNANTLVSTNKIATGSHGNSDCMDGDPSLPTVTAHTNGAASTLKNVFEYKDHYNPDPDCVKMHKVGSMPY